MHPEIERLRGLEIAPFLTYDEVMDEDSGLCFMHASLIKAWTRLRSAVGAPIAVTSGFRTRATNLRVGGSSGSMHLVGRALDLCCPTRDLSNLEYWPLYRDCGFTGLGRGQGWVHVDTRPADSPALWRYVKTASGIVRVYDTPAATRLDLVG